MQCHTYMHRERNRYQRLPKDLETNYLKFVAIYFLRRKLMLNIDPLINIMFIIIRKYINLFI